MKNLTIKQLEIIAEGVDLYNIKKVHEFATREAQFFVNRIGNINGEAFFEAIQKNIELKRIQLAEYERQLDEESTSLKSIIYEEIQKKREAIMQGQIDSVITNPSPDA